MIWKEIIAHNFVIPGGHTEARFGGGLSASSITSFSSTNIFSVESLIGISEIRTTIIKGSPQKKICKFYDILQKGG